jgi:hypothetical protein
MNIKALAVQALITVAVLAVVYRVAALKSAVIGA